MTNPAKRPFTRLAARLTGGAAALDALDAGACPFCKRPIDHTQFTDSRSRREYAISGLCQTCQDETFNND